LAAFRPRKAAEREVAYLTAEERARALRPRLNPYQEPDSPENLAIIAAHAAAIDPEPPTPAAPVARPAAIPAPARFRVSTAWFASICALSGERIRPGDQITNFQGCWCLYDAAEAEDDRRRAQGIQRRADQELAACFVVFMDRLPVAA
jgi:hypothetical protein